MSLLGADQRQKLTVRIRNALVATTIVASLLVGDMALLGTASVAAGETRTIQLYHVHSRESLNVTYMKNGRYVPSAMKQINRLLRDWRRNETITIDPETINLVWELHEDLGSHRPVNIVSGYRSPKTNAFLKRIGRNVAKKSQHMSGKAIDFYFPDVPTLKIRNSALVRKVGGVGYYRSSGGPTGFLHVDSGNVRHWGPAISNSQMAQAFREGSKTVGRRMRLNKGNDNTIAPEDSSNGGGLVAAIFGKKKPAPVALPKIEIDPYKEAIERLEQLQRDKPEAKAFHSKLTEIFRLYVFRKKGILSLQKTTADLVLQLKDLNFTKEQFDKLSQALRLSDFVKFAKYIPSNEDDNSVFEIILNTIKIIEQPGS